jgi:hypothetical protein
VSEKQTLLLAVNLNMYTLILVSLCAQSYSINAKKLKDGDRNTHTLDFNLSSLNRKLCPAGLLP